MMKVPIDMPRISRRASSKGSRMDMDQKQWQEVDTSESSDRDFVRSRNELTIQNAIHASGSVPTKSQGRAAG